MADRRQTPRLLAWAELLSAERTWAIESAGGLGKLLSQEPVAAVNTSWTCRRRCRRGCGCSARRRPRRTTVTMPCRPQSWGFVTAAYAASHETDKPMVLRLLVGRYDDLVSARTQAACRLHASLRELVAGGAPRRLSADRAAKLLRTVRPVDAVGIERKRLAVELLGDVRRLDRDLVAIKARIADAVAESNTALARTARCRPDRRRPHPGRTSVTPNRFATRARFAAYNGTAPIEASSGPRVRHRLNPRGNRKLNHAMHPHRGHPDRGPHTRPCYYDRKLAEGKTNKEALRVLKRRISDAVWRQLQLDLVGRR